VYLDYVQIYCHDDQGVQRLGDMHIALSLSKAATVENALKRGKY